MSVQESVMKYKLHQSVAGVAVPPRILTEGPDEITVVAGEDVVIDCETDGDPKPSLQWRKDMREINFFDSHIKHMQKESGALIIPKVNV